mmetsp:Transcript_7663/g.9087  ORF Transcript_7663/g.9087 Transcript_7663/m.9087 type:complete len:143 (-) Transcript_7663:157-585(-)
MKPAEHEEQEPEPLELNFPRSQAMHSEKDAFEYRPPSHVKQLLEPEPAYFPASQVVQESAPEKLNVPFEQTEQTVLDLFEYRPLSQLKQLVAASPEYLPASQFTQLGCPVEPWNFPARQVVQFEDDAVGACVPAEQAMQVEA